jgi:hypothetical protein
MNTSSSIAQPLEEQTDVPRVTYLYLRWLMVLLPAMLLVVTVSTALLQGKLESSISAYYGGPVRDVFVGSCSGRLHAWLPTGATHYWRTTP